MTPRRKALLYLAGGITAALLGTWLWILILTASKWSAMERRIDALIDEQARRESSRWVLRGEALPGDAWENYIPAAHKTRSLPNSALSKFVWQQKDADSKAVRKIVEENQPLIDQLRTGTRRATAKNPTFRRLLEAIPADDAYVLDFFVEDPDVIDSIHLADLAMSKAMLLDESSPREAMELLLDVLQYGRDLADNGTDVEGLIAQGLSRSVLGILKTLLDSRRLTAADLSELDRELEILDLSFPRRDCDLLNELALMGAFFRKGSYHGLRRAGPGSHPSEVEASWRYGFSNRLMAADGFLRIDRWMCEFAEHSRKPWNASPPRYDEMLVEIATSVNEWENRLTPSYWSSEREWRSALARLRLLRAAARFASTGEILDLEDPFGGKMLHSVQQRHLKVWSVGRTGNNHGGVGEFLGTGFDPSKPNIVLEIDR